MGFGTHFGPFSERGRYAKHVYSTTVLLLFCDLRGPRNELKSELKTSISTMMPKMSNIAPLGLHFGGFCARFLKFFRSWGAFGGVGAARQGRQARQGRLATGSSSKAFQAWKFLGAKLRCRSFLIDI